MKRSLVRCLASSCVAIALSDSVSAREVDPVTGAVAASEATEVGWHMAGLAVPFEANTGQTDERVAFTARTFAGTLFVTRAGQLVHSFPGLPAAGRVGAAERTAIKTRGPGWVLTETLVDAHPEVSGGAKSMTQISRFAGQDPAGWRTQIDAFQTVSLGEAWPGVKVVLAAHGNNVEKLFTLAPGADARRIAIQLRGATRMELAADGALVAHTGNGPVSFTPPVAWQEIDGQRKAVSVAYDLTGNRYGFLLGAHDPAHPVVIDPLLQATYLGGDGSDYAYAMALDGSSPPNVLVAGNTASSNFPGTTGGAQTSNHGGYYSQDAFIAKLTNGLRTLTQVTYLGGSDDDYATAIAVDWVSGAIYLTGATASTNFPGTTGGAKATNSSSPVYSTGFVAKLTSDLKSLTQATYLGGSRENQPRAIALDGSMPPNVFVAGYTTSTDFPHTTGGAQAVYGGYGDGFVAKLTNDLTAFVQASYLGGSDGADAANAIALDATTGDVFVVGYTGSFNFPGTTGGGQASHAADGGFGDAFVAKLTNGLTTLARATYLGGNATDQATSVVLDGSTPRNVFVAGLTQSSDFPHVIGGAQLVNGGGTNGFVAKLSNDLAGVSQATYLGGSGWDQVNAIALDGSAPPNVFVAGTASSTDFPGTTGGAQAAFGGAGTLYGGDAFVAKLTNNLTRIIQATYLGGTGDDGASAIALDATSGNVFVAGYTVSTNFPGTAGGAQGGHAADGFGADAFVAKLTPDLAAVAPAPTKLTITSVNGGANPTLAVAFNVVVQAQDGTSTAQNVVASTVVALTRATGTGTLGGTLACTITAGSNSCTVIGVTYSVAESGVSLTATRTSGDVLAAGTSAPFTVNPGAPTTSYAAPSATGTGNITASFSSNGGCSYSVAQFIPLTGNAASPPAGSAPTGETFPQGLFNFTVSGCTPGSVLNFTITYPQALPSGTQYWKYGPTSTDATAHWYVLPALVSGNTITFSITDAGLGDDDYALGPNGTIVDQSGPGAPGVPPTQAAEAIPTLNEWMLALLGLVLLGVGVLRLQRTG